MKRIVRTTPRTAEEAAKYSTIRKQVAAELPALVERRQKRIQQVGTAGMLSTAKALT